ncbi:transcription elongation factor GreA [Candidatus Kuenenbacteria bacterium]|nr:transcription elongation factor GreA [Candidatus Kuenenbacteria bacterium]
MAINNQIYITAEGLAKLKKEFEDLVNIERKKIAERIQEAKELGDLSENAEYSAAKEEQSFLEMRIMELDNIIKNAVLINPHNNSKTIVDVGSLVSFTDKSGTTREYQIVGSREADPGTGKISNESPLGRAFLGKKVGEEVSFQAPKGMVNFKIISIK